MRLILTIFLCWHLVAPAATYTAASISRDDVQAAVAAATHGDVVVIPPGIATWTNVVRVTNAVRIYGAGIGQTVITNNQSPSTSYGVSTAFNFSCPTNSRSGLYGMTLDGNRSSQGVAMFGEDRYPEFRIARVAFANFRGRAVLASGLFKGVVDHCDFLDVYKVVDAYAAAEQNIAWQNPISVGSISNVVIENCTIRYESWYPNTVAASFASGQGGSRTIRYCIWINNNTGLPFSPCIDAHGNQDPVDIVLNTGTHRGTFMSLVYRNEFFVNSVGKTWRWMDLRGGINWVFENQIYGSDPGNSILTREEDGPCDDNRLTTYPGYDQHWIHAWSNYVRGDLIVTNSVACSADRDFIIPGTNLFWTPPEPLTLLTYPHPFVTEEDSPTGGTTNTVRALLRGARVTSMR